MARSESQENQGLAGLDADSRKLVLDTVRQLRKKLLTKENILEWDKNEVFPEDIIRKMLFNTSHPMKCITFIPFQ